MDEKVLRLASRVKQFLVQKWGSSIDRILLYGSHARGTATEDSDIDLLVVVREPLEPRKVRESLSDLLFDIILEEGELVSVIVLTEDVFAQYDFPLLLNVRREGIPV